MDRNRQAKLVVSPFFLHETESLDVICFVENTRNFIKSLRATWKGFALVRLW